MTYQEVVNIIRATAATVNPTGTFVHGKKLFGSTKSINGPDPVIVLLPFVSEIDILNNYATDHKIQIAFWQQDAPDSSAVQQEAIIAAMDVLCRTFILELDEQESFTIEGIKVEPDYRQLMSTMSGYLCQFTIKSAVNVC